VRNPATILTRSLTRGLFGPVFQREVRSSGRSVTTYWIRGGYVLALTFVSCMLYFGFTAESRFGSRGNAENLQQLQTFAPALGSFYVWFQFAVMCFVASTLTAPAICDERRKGSLSTLIATPLTATQIVLGKLSGRLTQLVILLLAGVPLLLAVRVFGGVSAWFVLSATCMTLCTALLHASIALAASARVRTPTMASGTGFVSGIAFCLLPMFLALFISVTGFRGMSEVLLGVSPYVALGFETARSLGESPGVSFWNYAWLLACGYALGLAALFLGIAIYRFKRLAATAGEAGFSPEPKRTRAATRAATRLAKPAAQASVAAGSATSDSAHTPPPQADEIIIRGNPVLWRELRQPVFLRRWHPWAALGVITSVLGFAYYQVGLNEPVPMFATHVVLSAIFVFQACIIGAGAIAGERESRSLETLLATPLSARSIVVAKWLGALRRLYPIPALTLALLLALGVLPGTFRIAVVAHYILIFAAPAAALVASGIWLSVVTRKTSVAATLNVLLAFAFWAGVPFIVMMTIMIVTMGQGPGSAWEPILATPLIAHPGPMYITALSATSAQFRGNRAYHTFVEFTPELFMLACVASTVLYAVIAWGFLQLAAMALAGRTNRRA
jgi:ABC-type transport system involved in multi-copper enzyme maturation permease subunit